MNENLASLITGRTEAIVRATAQRRLEEIYTACDKVPLAKLLSIMLRKKGELHNDPFNWSDKTFLKNLERYQREFSESYDPETGNFDLDEE